MGLKQLFTKIKGKVKVGSEISRHNKFIKVEQKTILEQYKLMGEKVYNLFEQGADVGQLFEGDCTEVSKKMDIIREHQQKIYSLKGESRCPKCKSVLERKSSYCSKCGERL